MKALNSIKRTSGLVLAAAFFATGCAGVMDANTDLDRDEPTISVVAPGERSADPRTGQVDIIFNDDDQPQQVLPPRNRHDGDYEARD